MSRLSLSSGDKLVRDWFVKQTKSLGCKVHIDAMGNIFAIRAGRNEGPATFMGSHLDTQPSGGRYDGVLGVLAGLEALRVLEDNKVSTAFPIGLVNWTK
jgi:acetylornithine deacetylase/succinyl-diaminopimelate desuccinylase-like protein